MLAKASPRNPYVAMAERSSKALSLEVVNLSHRIGKSSRCEV